MRVAFMPGQAEGAWPNGTRVAKIRSDPDDGHQDGAEATILSSHVFADTTIYFVRWDDMAAPVMILGDRVRLIER